MVMSIAQNKIKKSMENIQATEEMKQRTLRYLEAQQTRRSRSFFQQRPHMAIGYVMAAICVFLLAGTGGYAVYSKSGAYISINTRGMSKEQQMEVLFGIETGETDGQARRNGAFVKADHGTVFIKGVEHLTLRVQHQICKMLMSHSISRTDASPMDNLDVRIMAFSKVNLRSLVKSGEFSEELFYLLSGLTVDIPPLNERPEDLKYYFEKFFKENCKKYHKYFVLTQGVYDRIGRLSWKGNVIQLQRFCERLVLTSEKRSIDEVMVQKLYEELYPYIGESGGRDKVIVYKSKEAVELGALLEKYHGNRSLVAEELGISTTTLWRRMKKYGIEAAYGK